MKIVVQFQNDPEKRPTISQILTDDFMTMGYLPPRLPTSCLTMAPRFDTKPNEVKTRLKLS
jgi:polo-like kinase 1